MKLCPKCDETKPLDEFFLRPNGKPQSYCKTCTRRLRNELNKQRRRPVQVPVRIHAAIKADAERNGISITQWMTKAVVGLTRIQCAVPGCLNQAPNEDRLCHVCSRRAGLTEARRA